MLRSLPDKGRPLEEVIAEVQKWRTSSPLVGASGIWHSSTCGLAHLPSGSCAQHFVLDQLDADSDLIDDGFGLISHEAGW